MTSTISGIFTALSLVMFLGICVWAWSDKRKESFDQAASLPLQDDEVGEE